MFITVTLGGNRFNISDEGYKRLKFSVSKVSCSQPEYMRSAVEEDVENRLAKYFMSRLSTSGVITGADVDSALADLGLGGPESDEQASENTKADEERASETGTEHNHDEPGVEDVAGGKSKESGRLSLNRDDVLIAGVCGGIARKAGCDAIWIRLLFVCVTLFLWQPWVPVVYLILWFVLPSDDGKSGDDDIRLDTSEGGSRSGGCLRIGLIVLLCLVAVIAVLLGLLTVPFFMMRLVF